MQIRTDRKVAFALFDALLERWRAEPKRFPYNQPDAVIPQTIIPPELRAERYALACFYFFLCIYMRGGIESLQVFRALIRLWRDRPELFDPHCVQWLSASDMEAVLREYIGWDAKNAGETWVENARSLVQHWRGSPLRLIKGVRSYREALRRIKNKRTVTEQRAAGARNQGFRGFQPKMVSMLLYFYDYEGLLEKRFLYPTPADFHNFRLGLNQGAIILPEGVRVVRHMEDLAWPWRQVTVAYLRSRSADPIELADALWLFSLVMCGNSPLTMSTEKENGSGMFEEAELAHTLDLETFRQPRFRLALERTCLRCSFIATCRFAIPSGPYYRKGLLMLTPRARIEDIYKTADPDTPLRCESRETKNHELFEPGR